MKKSPCSTADMVLSLILFNLALVIPISIVEADHRRLQTGGAPVSDDALQGGKTP